MIRTSVLPGLVLSGIITFFMADDWVHWLQVEAFVIPIALLCTVAGWMISEYLHGPMS
jgi:hypothetical protein